MLENILNSISIIVTVLDLIVKPKAPPTSYQVVNVYVRGSYVPAQHISGSSSDNGELILVLFGLLALGIICYPYREIMVFAFSIFWWFVLVVTRISKRTIVTPAGHKLIPIILIEAALTMMSLLCIGKLPTELYSENIILKLYPYFITGSILVSYMVLFLLGILLVIASLSKPQSKLFKISSRWLYTCRFAPALPMAGALASVLMLWFYANK